MKFKKILATVLVAVCAFMLVGCGQMTAKESVESAVSNATSIQTSVGSMTGDSSATGLAMKVNPFATLTDFMEVGEEMGEEMGKLGQKLVSFGVEVAELGVLSTAFLADYENLEIADADVTELNKHANTIKDLKNKIESEAKKFVDKMEEMEEKVGEGDMEALMNMDLDELIDIAEKLIDQVKATVEKLGTATTAIEGINTVLVKYTEE